ncbi:MAG TPA: transposase [Solirubrobacterales bacterium]
MPRKPRQNLEGGVYHVYARGNAQSLIFADDADRRIYLRLLGKVVVRQRWRCLAYCLMGNHVHLLLETPCANLSPGMQRLQGRYAQTFNSRHGRSGHVFQGRYGAVRITSDGQLCAAAAYIARNPVEATLCERPEQWRWSSYRAAIQGSPPTWLDAHRLLSYFGTVDGAARRRYAQMSGGANLKGVRPLS